MSNMSLSCWPHVHKEYFEVRNFVWNQYFTSAGKFIFHILQNCLRESAWSTVRRAGCCFFVLFCFLLCHRKFTGGINAQSKNCVVQQTRNWTASQCKANRTQVFRLFRGEILVKAKRFVWRIISRPFWWRRLKDIWYFRSLLEAPVLFRAKREDSSSEPKSRSFASCTESDPVGSVSRPWIFQACFRYYWPD